MRVGLPAFHLSAAENPRMFVKHPHFKQFTLEMKLARVMPLNSVTRVSLDFRCERDGRFNRRILIAGRVR